VRVARVCAGTSCGTGSPLALAHATVDGRHLHGPTGMPAPTSLDVCGAASGDIRLKYVYL